MDNEEILKMDFINENIIEMGIDIEDIKNFSKNKTGKEWESLSLDELKNILELYNNKDKADDNKTENKEEEEKKRKRRE